MYNYVNFSDLEGHVITKIKGVRYGSDEIEDYDGLESIVAPKTYYG